LTHRTRRAHQPSLDIIRLSYDADHMLAQYHA
jgi:hypothetical protein